MSRINEGSAHLRAGKARSEALRNLADRTGVDDLSALVTMLIQTDKFGTSVAQSLRVYSETLRANRPQRAEEQAAQTGVRMVFPLVVVRFPAVRVGTHRPPGAPGGARWPCGARAGAPGRGRPPGRGDPRRSWARQR